MSYRLTHSVITAALTLCLCNGSYAQASETYVAAPAPTPSSSSTGTTTIITAPAPASSSSTETTIVTAPAPASPSATTPTTATVTKETIIVTPVPAAKESIATPSGYAHCFNVQSGWYKDAWVPQHRICQYENMPGKVAWVEGYWACTKYNLDQAVCTNWDWKPGHWAETLVVY